MKKNVILGSKKAFSRLLLKWDRDQNKRQMPWKGENDPYRIWLSEIILQQTRVEQGWSYYNKFIKAFPNIQSLAAASEKTVLKYWEGLGYYSRCRNLIETARLITSKRKGRFPDSYTEILSLKGVGPYTAAAISSFAYNLPHAVVDGNVVRVLARVFGIREPADSSSGKKLFATLAEELLDKKEPGRYNQAIMDFGATVCKPAIPQCDHCKLKKYCYAFTHNKTQDLPVKSGRVRIRQRWFYYLFLEHRGRLAIHRRSAKDIWEGLYEFPLVETGAVRSIPDILAEAEKRKWLIPNGYRVSSVTPLLRHQLTHQLIQGRMIHVRTEKKPTESGWSWVTRSAISRYPFPRFFHDFLKNMTG
ncbi:MAG: A/G-specific adenine glycosylase [Chitinophagaceae bacterium]